MLSNRLLMRLGWQHFFEDQLSPNETRDSIIARIIEQSRHEIVVNTGIEILNLCWLPAMPEMVVGDWVLLNANQTFLRVLQRKTYFSRKTAGKKPKRQLLSANVDTAFIIASMNEDFSLNRIERYLSLVNQSGAKAVILLSKADQSDVPEAFVSAVQAIDASLTVKAVNCLDIKTQHMLSPWLQTGQTVAMLGSSGVGKSTLTNTLLGENRQRTSEIRLHDKKGRHTTTRRSLIALDTGGLILDIPGIKEIQLADCKTGIMMTFSDILAYAKQCYFNDCEHQHEPKCAVLQAIEHGKLTKRRLESYQKLAREEALNATFLSEKSSVKAPKRG